MSKESRTIRPFGGLAGIRNVLQDVVFLFGPEHCQAGATLTVNLQAAEFVARDAALQWAANETGLEHLKDELVAGAASVDIELEDLALCVIASTSYTKAAEQLLILPLTDLGALERVTPIKGDGAQPTPLLSSHHGFALSVYVVLARELERRPLRPFRRGTWLAQATFTVSTKLPRILFRPRPLTEEVRRRFELRIGTMRYLDVDDHDIFEALAEQDGALDFYIDEEVLGRLNVAASTTVGAVIQLQLAQDLIAAVIHTAAADERFSSLTLADIKGSIIDRIVHLAAGPSASEMQRERVFDAISKRPRWVIALAEDAIGIKKLIALSLQGEDEA